MAVKYCRVNEAPSDITSEEYIITMPKFFEEIKKASRFRGQQSVITTNYLRAIFVEIVSKYDIDVNPYTDMHLARYNGRPSTTDDSTSAIINEIIQKEKPDIIGKALDFAIRNRPKKTKIIYFVAPDFTHTGAFITNGMDSIQLKEIDTLLNKKKKKSAKKE